jgi:uncharacterized protein (DUF4213/DUF364 family)
MADIDAVKDAMFPLLERMFDGSNQVYMVDVLLVLVGPTGDILPYEFVEANADKAGTVHIFHIDPFSGVVSLSQPAVRTAARQIVEQTLARQQQRQSHSRGDPSFVPKASGSFELEASYAC